jgi:hypothetical protein
MGQDHFFHYSAVQGYKNAIWGNTYGGKTGLIRLKRFINLSLQGFCDLPDEACDGAVFGLLEPQPLGWISQDYHEGQSMFETILSDMSMQDRSIVLLKVHVTDPQKVMVAEQGVHMHPDYSGSSTLDEVTKQVKQAYWRSLVPFAEYDQDTHGYTMPEVVSFADISLDQIEIVTVYDDVSDVMNEMRRKAGREELPPYRKPPEPDYSVLCDILKL